MMTLRRPLFAAAVVSALLAAWAAQAVDIGHGEVAIYRDAKGVPHIEGATSAAVMYGQGYAMSQDRLAQMEVALRTKQGRRAEILGPGLVAADKAARDVLLPPAELMRMYAAIPAEHQAMMQAFVDGVNRQIAEIQADPTHKTPYEYTRWGVTPKPWTLLDFLSYVAAPHAKSSELDNLAFLNAMVTRHGPRIGRQIFNDIVPINDPDTPLTIAAGEDLAPAQPMPKDAPYRPGALTTAIGRFREAAAGAEPPSGASRCLVIGPQKSASGYPLMMEATNDGPEMHLSGGGFETAGWAFAPYGAPLMGRAADHGWLMTSGHADVADTYAEKLNPADRHQYWFNGAWRTMETRAETILVKGAAPVTYEVAVTVHGPVVQWDTANGVAYSVRNAERGHELESWVGIVEMQRAHSLADFQSKGVASLAWSVGVCYGGVDGQIGFWEAGRTPKRPANVDSRLPTPGTGEYEWSGFLSFEEHPRVINPKSGYIHTWNSKAAPWSREGDDARIGKTYRTWLGNQLAAEGHGLTLLDMREINRKIWNAGGARDRSLTTPAFFAPYIRAAAAASDDAEVKQAAGLMLSFNGIYEDLDVDGKYDNAGGTLFREWLTVAPDIIFSGSVGDWWSKIDADRYQKYQSSLLLRALQGKDAGLPLAYDYFRGRDRTAVIIQTIRQTIDAVKPRYAGAAMADWRQPVFWKYLDAGRMDPAKPPLPGQEPFRRTSAVLGYGPPVVKHHGGEGWVGLMEINPRNPALFSVVEAGGQNQFIDPAGKGNPNLTDQVMMHANNELKRIDMSLDDVKRTAVSTTKLKY